MTEEKKPEVKTEQKETPAQAPKPPELKRAKPRFAVVHVYSSKNDTIITATAVITGLHCTSQLIGVATRMLVCCWPAVLTQR